MFACDVTSLSRTSTTNIANVHLYSTHRAHPQFKSTTWHSKQVLRNLNLEVGGGQTVALVGQSGSGKSTVLGLIFYYYYYHSCIVCCFFMFRYY